MFLITDKNNIIVDFSTRKENLSCGLTYQDYKQYEVAPLPVNIGDTFDGETVLANEKLQSKREQDATNEMLITQKIRDTAIAQLKLEGKLSEDFS